MPKNDVNDLITDQEIAFARQVLFGKMTDRQAAEAAGLNPDTAAYTKSKPRVRDWMLKHRAAVEQKLVEQDTQELRRFNVSRDQALARLWEIANMDPERTRNSMSAQVKAVSMIVAIEALIPDRRGVAAHTKPAPPPVQVTEQLRTQQDGQSVDPQPPPRSAAQGESAFGPTLDLSQAAFSVRPPNPSQMTPLVPTADYFSPNTRAPFSTEKDPFARRL
jgi:hypothetical protein